MCVPLRLTKASLGGIGTGQSWGKIIFRCTRSYVCTLGRFWVCATYCEPFFGVASFRPKVALSHGSISKITWLHNNRVYRMADEWWEIEYHSSYVLRNGFGERGNYTLFQKMNNGNGMQRYILAANIWMSLKTQLLCGFRLFCLHEPSWLLVIQCNLQTVDAFYVSLQIRCAAHNLRIAGFTEYKKQNHKGPTFSFDVYCCTHRVGWRSQRQSEKVNIRNAWVYPLG